MKLLLVISYLLLDKEGKKSSKRLWIINSSQVESLIRLEQITYNE